MFCKSSINALQCWGKFYLAVEKEKCTLQFNATSKHVEQVSEGNDDDDDEDDNNDDDDDGNDDQRHQKAHGTDFWS